MITIISGRFFTKLALLICLISLPATSYAEKLILQLRWLHQAQFIGYYVALHKGYYEQQGLDVEIRSGGPGLVPWEEVNNGHAQYAVDNTNALTAFARKEPLVALAALFQHSPSVFLAKRSSGIRNVTDLINRRVMMFPDAQDPELLAMLHYQGIELNNIRMTPTSANLNDLLEDRVDAFNAYITNEPFILQQQNEPYTVINPRNYGINFYSDVLITSTFELSHNPERVENFRRASLRGWDYALKHPEEALTILVENYRPDKSLDHLRYELNMVREMVMPDFVELGHMNAQRWYQIQNTLSELGILQQPVNLDDFIYTPKRPLNLDPWLHWIMASVIAAVVLVAISVYMLYLNRRLQKEVRRRIRSEQQLKHLASHDSLTNLPNRTALNSHLEQTLKVARRQQLKPAVLFIDLDGFKDVNDSAGHKTGDLLLVQFTNRISQLLRESDLFGRLAGDEFLIITPDSNNEGAGKLANKIQLSLEKGFMINNRMFYVSASIGVAIYSDPAETSDELLIRADRAMYQTKHGGKAGISFAPPPSPDNGKTVA